MPMRPEFLVVGSGLTGSTIARMLADGGHSVQVLERRSHVGGTLIEGTVITREHPYTAEHPDHYEYPFPDEHNANLYQAYRARASELNDVVICGRLGEYRYFDMDQAIGHALKLGCRILTAPLSLNSQSEHHREKARQREGPFGRRRVASARKSA